MTVRAEHVNLIAKYKTPKRTKPLFDER
jgi:hypothetical protein